MLRWVLIASQHFRPLVVLGDELIGAGVLLSGLAFSMGVNLVTAKQTVDNNIIVEVIQMGGP